MRTPLAGSHRATSVGFATFVAITGVLFACDPDILHEVRSTDYVVAQFDPAAEVPIAPKPNDLAISASTGLVTFADDPDATDAELEFNAYLRTLDGFPTSSTATITFSAALDPASVAVGALSVVDITDPAAPVAVTKDVSISYVAQRQRVSVRAPWQRAHRYAIALLGGSHPQALRGAKGAQVIGAPAFILTRARKSLVTCSDLSDPTCAPSTTLITGTDASDARGKAITLERARLKLSPALTYLETQGIQREQLAAVWSFSTTSMALVTFDPANSVIPFPNELLMKDGHVNLPILSTDDATSVTTKTNLNTLDGFSTTAHLMTEFGDATGAADARIDGATLSPNQFVLVTLDKFKDAQGQNEDREVVPVEVTCRSCQSSGTLAGAEPDQIALRPTRPLRSHTAYAVYWLRGAKGVDGKLVNIGSVFALTRLVHPVAIDGKSQLEILDDASATQLEKLRQMNSSLLDLSSELKMHEGQSFTRDEVLLTWKFTTQTTTERLPTLARLPVTTWNLPTAMTGGPGALTTVDTSVLAQLSLFTGEDLHSQIRWAKEGWFTTGNALADATDKLSNGQVVPTEGGFTSATLTMPRPEQVRFLLGLPKTSKYPDGRIPIVLFQHGVSRSRRDAALVANTVAKHGYAILAIDTAMHGLRSFCQNNSECRSGTQCVDHRCPGGYKIGAGFIPSTSDPLETPVISGNQFVSTENSFFTRDHFHQQMMDLTQLIRVLQDTTDGLGAIDADDPTTASVVERLDPTEVKLLGMSLGGILGGLAAATIPEISRVTLNVPGGSPTDIVLRSTFFKSQRMQLDASLAERGIAPGSQAYEFVSDVSRWAMDPADPQNYGRHFIDSPLLYPNSSSTSLPIPKKGVFISWVKSDETVPNYCTELLLQSIEATTQPMLFTQKQYPAGGHAALMNVQNASYALSLQEDAVKWLDGIAP